MPVKGEYVQWVQWVLGQLAGVGDVQPKPMFGCFGLYRGNVFFGIIAADTLYFKVGDATRSDYESRGMSRFRPYANRSRVSMNYYEVPADVLEDADECGEWAQRAVAACVGYRTDFAAPCRVNRRTRTR